MSSHSSAVTQKGWLHCCLREVSSVYRMTILSELSRLCTCACMHAGVWGALSTNPSPEGRLSSPSFVLIPSQPAKESLPWKGLESL